MSPEEAATSTDKQFVSIHLSNLKYRIKSKTIRLKSKHKQSMKRFNTHSSRKLTSSTNCTR